MLRSIIFEPKFLKTATELGIEKSKWRPDWSQCCFWSTKSVPVSVWVLLTFPLLDCTLIGVSLITKTLSLFCVSLNHSCVSFCKSQDDRKDCILWGWWGYLRTFVQKTKCQWCTKPPVVLSSKYAILVRRYGLFRDEIFLYWFCVNDTQSTSWHCHRLKRARIDQILMHIVSHMLGADLKAVSSSLLVKVAEQRILQVIYHWFCAV